jgi:hypothetical protein
MVGPEAAYATTLIKEQEGHGATSSRESKLPAEQVFERGIKESHGEHTAKC